MTETYNHNNNNVPDPGDLSLRNQLNSTQLRMAQN